MLPACDDCVGADVLQLFSNLIFGPLVQGFKTQCVLVISILLILGQDCVHVHVHVHVCAPMPTMTLALCSVVLWSSSDDTLKEQCALGSCRGQQFGLALRGQVLQMMSAPHRGG